MELQEFLVWLSGVGAVFAVSWIFEFFQFAWFENLESKKKQLVFLVISVVVGVGAKLVLDYAPENIIAFVADYFPVVFAIFSYLFLGDGFHTSTKTD